MTFLRDVRGSMAVTVVLLLPLLMLAVAGVAEIGMLRIVAAKAQTAADLAAVVAVNDQDDAELARSGRLVPAADASLVAREYFAANLGSLADSLAAAPAEIASAAYVWVGTPGALEPRTGRMHERATVRLTATVPVRTAVFGSLLLRPVTDIPVAATSSAR